jgi:tight adherence protein C
MGSDRFLLLLSMFSIFLAVASALWVLLSNAEERATVKSSLRSLDEYQRVDLRSKELEAPLLQRVVAPVGRSLVALGRRIMPGGYMEGVRRRLVVAGKPSPEELDRFRAIRVLSAAAVPATLVLALVLPASTRDKVLIFLFLGAAFLLGPDAVLNRQMEERRQAIRVRLPDVIDMLTISVEAGLGFDQALERTVAAIPGPLTDEFARMLGEMRAGAGRADSMRAMDARTDVPELRSFILALIQAETFGVSIGRILRGQSEEMRIKRRQQAQEQAQKAPVKLLFPMVLCVFPGIFVVLLGPSALNFVSAGF